jgi:hypothetical protein
MATCWPGARGMVARSLRPASPPCPGRGARRCTAPHFADAQEEQQLWEELRDHGTSLNRALNEVLRIHGGPRVACLPGASTFVSSLLSSLLCCLRVCPCGAALICFCLLVAGVGAPCPRQVRHPRPDER